MKDKLRVLYVLKYLQQFSDETHHVTSNDIAHYLNDNGINVERKSIYRDIKFLSEFGYDIIHEKGYYLASSVLEEVELKMLIDAISSASFISIKKTEKIENKLLSSFTSKYQGEQIKKHRFYDIKKSADDSTIYTIDALNNAINNNQAITFNYFDIDINKKKVYRDNKYQGIPRYLYWNNNRYYLIMYMPAFKSFSNYRVDKMDKIETYDHEEQLPSLDIDKFLQEQFNMYTGEHTHIRLRFEKKLQHVFTDRFGFDPIINVDKNDPNYLIGNFNVQTSPTFYSWLFQFTNQVSIIDPPQARQEYREMCEEVIKSLA